MASARAKRYTFNVLLALVWLGIPIFLVKVFYPDWVYARDGIRELETAQTQLSTWVRKGNLPTRTKIEAAEDYADGLFGEYESAESYFRRRDAMLERPLLETYTGDPRHVEYKYKEVKEQLKARGRYSLAADAFRVPFMPEYAWEAPTRVPPREEFESLEKKACVAEVLVARLGGGQPAVVGHVGVFEPVETVPEGTVADFEDSEDVEPFISYVIWPAEVHFLAPFPYCGALLSRLTGPPDDYPPIVLYGVDVEARDATQVMVVARVGVLDFN
jgi:hypothetical protein